MHISTIKGSKYHIWRMPDINTGAIQPPASGTGSRVETVEGGIKTFSLYNRFWSDGEYSYINFNSVSWKL